jgi:hypothetical protein
LMRARFTRCLQTIIFCQKSKSTDHIGYSDLERKIIHYTGEGFRSAKPFWCQ